MIKGQEDFCSFTMSNLKRENYFKFFPLPMRSAVLNREGWTFSVKLTLYPRGYENDKKCHHKKIFQIKIIKTHNLKLGFTRIYGGRNCYASKNIHTGYDSVSFNTVRNFVESDEVRYKIQNMFPIVKATSRALNYSRKNRNYNYVEGYCNNSLAKDRPTKTVGLLSDISGLEYIRTSLGYHKLIAVVPESYFVFHRGINHDSSGFMISPLWKGWKWFLAWSWKSGFLGGSWNVAFVHEDQVNKGTVSHELAHTVGQGREFYEPHEQCRPFRGSPLELCDKYKIPLALEADHQSWTFVEKKFSIMSNEGKNIEDKWIDRDTFQKTFKVLSKKVVIPNDEELLGKSIIADYRKEKKSSVKAVVSGFYHEKEKDFVVPKIEIRKTKLLTPSFYPNTENTKLPVVIFQLKEGGRLLKEIKRPLLKFQLEILYKNKPPETEPFEFSPLMAVFKLPEDYKKRDLRIVVLSPWKKRIWTAPVPKKRESKPTKGQNVVFINNI